MVAGEQGRIHVAEGVDLVLEQFQGFAAIEFGIVAHAANNAAVLVVLHKAVIWIARKGKGTEPQRIERWQFEQSRLRRGCNQIRQIELYQVMTKQNLRLFGESFQFMPDRRLDFSSEFAMECLAGIRLHGGKRFDAPVLHADFQVKRQTPERQVESG